MFKNTGALPPRVPTVLASPAEQQDQLLLPGHAPREAKPGWEEKETQWDAGMQVTLGEAALQLTIGREESDTVGLVDESSHGRLT